MISNNYIRFPKQFWIIKMDIDYKNTYQNYFLLYNLPVT